MLLLEFENSMRYKPEHVCSICDVLGDSGGPLLEPFSPGNDPSAGRPELDILVGIVSFGDELSSCGMSELPVVFTDVSSFLDWIHDVMNVR